SRSAQLAPHQPALAVPGVRRRQEHALESVLLEEVYGADVAADEVDPLTARVRGVSLDDLGAMGSGVLDRALEQLVHEAAPAVPRPHDEAHDRPGVPLVHM